MRLPKEFRFKDNEVLVWREGDRVVLAPIDDWPEGYWENFPTLPDDFELPRRERWKDRIKF